MMGVPLERSLVFGFTYVDTGALGILQELTPIHLCLADRAFVEVVMSHLKIETSRQFRRYLLLCDAK